MAEIKLPTNSITSFIIEQGIFAPMQKEKSLRFSRKLVSIIYVLCVSFFH